jgi:hypothetical protein
VKKQKTVHDETNDVHEEPSNEILGMRFIGRSFFFYKIPVNNSVVQVMKTGQETHHEETEVIRIGGAKDSISLQRKTEFKSFISWIISVTK